MPEETGVEVIGLAKIRDRYRRLGGRIDDLRVLDIIGEYLKTSIKTRTLAGKDIEGSPFVPYSAGYERTRRKKGLPTRPDLFFTGTMLGSLTADVSHVEESVKLYFAPGTAEGSNVQNAAKAFFNQQTRPFFGISAENVQKIIDIYRDFIREAMRR